MFRKLSMILAAGLLCLPIGGGVGRYYAAKAAASTSSTVAADARWYVDPFQLCILCGCLMVLALTASRRWAEADAEPAGAQADGD